ncbi:chemotaxis protein CheW [Methylotuvimicrobium sp.]|uniref:chemotaxis protein CheA n=1 Tax=Methylotuvimicrobium sp. TaxID=2822413 RepID=UPI003D649209
MAIDLDDEILQDFLVESGEIIELLGEQLVQLEQMPNDYDLLNAIFRGFHTVKGGAGFLAIDPLVEICHKAEDVFNVLRQGDRKVDPKLMDVVLQVLDIVNEMFGQIRAGHEPEPASPALLNKLQAFTSPGKATEQRGAKEQEQEPSPIASADEIDIVEKEFESMLNIADEESAGIDDSSNSDEITEEEFEQLLDTLHGKGASPTAPKITQGESQPASAADEITEDEFEQLLDALHGKGGSPTSPKSDRSETASNAGVESENAEKVSMPAKKSVPATSDSDEITEDEFENLLDQLHGKGKFNPSVVAETGDQAPNKAPEKKPVAEFVPGNKNKPSPATKSSSAANSIEQHDTKDQKPAASKAASSGAPQIEPTVRVDTQVLDDIMNMVGELVLVRNRFQTLRSASDSDDQMAKAIANLDVVTADLQLAVMKTRMQPIKKVFGRFPRVVRDLARSLNKQIRLELVGEETDLDKNLVEALADPLVHLVRNSVDHGIESPEERTAAGKPAEGVVLLTASQQGDHIELSIKDDGKGMNANALRAKVVEKGLMDADTAARLDQRECFNLIFMPGFSTKAEISDVSGRGVGMDVVKTRISQMNGAVEVDSKEGIGTTITIKVPLTLAIMPTLMVKLADQAFALPLGSVMEILDLDLRVTNVVDGQQVVMVRNKALPLFYLGEWLVQDPNYVLNKQASAHVVVVNAGGRQVGFVVDQLIGQEEVVIKALGAKLQGLDGLSGATITGDGRIALILDVPGLMKRYAS